MTRTLFSLLFLILLAACVPARSTPASAPQRTTPEQRQAAVVRAVEWLHGQFQEGALRGMAACDVARVVAQAGEDPQSPRWTRDGRTLVQLCEMNFAEMPRKDPADAAKALRAVLAVRGNPRDFAREDLILLLEGALDPATGLYHSTNLFRHNLVIIALGEADRPIPEEAVAALV
jgi:hypothetical protein